MPGTPRWHLPKDWTLDQRIAFYTTITETCHVWHGPVKCTTDVRGVKSDIRPIIGYQHDRINVARYILSNKLGEALSVRLEACHTCNNTLCLNPAHMYAGTHHDNMLDMAVDGKYITHCGYGNHTLEQHALTVKLIREGELPYTKIASQTGYTRNSVFRIAINIGIRRNKSWHLSA